MTRYKAATLHFIACLAVAFVLSALCWLVWYPAPMLMTLGGHEIFLLVVGIDVVVGPLLTLVVFNVEKKSLKFDLAVILILQIAAFVYGTSALLEARPAYVAALGDSFQVVQANEVTDENLAKANTTLPWWGPQWVGTKEVVDPEWQSGVQAVQSVGGDKGHFPQLHIPYESMKERVLAKALPVSELKKINPGKENEIDQWLRSRGYDEQTAKFQPIKITASRLAVLVDANTAKVIGISTFNI
jgi:hypothetical protein